MANLGLREDADRTADRRRAWFLAGSLLIAATIMSVAIEPQLYGIPGVKYVSPVVSGAALLVFAFGLRGQGSVTARRPLGTTALVVLALLGVAVPLLVSLVPFDQSNAGAAVAISLFEPLLEGAAALIAVVQIGRAGVIPAPWNWAPSWAFAVIAVATVVQYVGFSAGVISQQTAGLLVAMNLLVWVGASVFLGVLAIVLATRPSPTRTVSIIDSES